MKIRDAAIVALLMASTLLAQRYKLSSVNAETPDGKVLQQAMQESDPAKKLTLMETYITQFPKTDESGWVLTQMQSLYLKANDYDKTLSTGQALLAMDAADLDASYNNLKAAEGKKDADAILQWSDKTSELARKAATAPKREGDGDEEYKQAVDYAKQVDTYAEYSLYSAALQSGDPQKTMLLVDALEKRNPKSQYIPRVLGKYAVAAQQTNSVPRAVALGEKTFADGQYNEDMLLTMSDYYMKQGKAQDKVVLYSTKAVELMSVQPKPEGMADADWEKKKNMTTGIGNWMAGISEASQNKYSAADKHLRAALPYIKDNDQLMAGALFNLGLANYKMGQASKNRTQIADAVRFSEQAAAIKGPLQAQAAKNVTVIRKEFAMAPK
jgi:hypothetical protein